VKGRADALYACADSLVNANGVRIVTLALAARLPTIHYAREYLAPGVCYPMDLIIETFSGALRITSTKFCAVRSPAIFLLNSQPSLSWSSISKTAKVLGITIPPTLLARADEVIE
jgi:hypothetical protein